MVFAGIGISSILLLIAIAVIMHAVLLAPLIVAIMGALGERVENERLRRGESV